MTRLKQLKQLPCCSCGTTPVDIAHANWGECGKGLGIKADDRYTIPLCRTCHQWLDHYQGLNRNQAKQWFMDKLDFVNQVLDDDNNTVF